MGRSRLLILILAMALAGCSALLDALLPHGPGGLAGAPGSPGSAAIAPGAPIAGPLFGRVVGEDGQPAAGVKVAAYLAAEGRLYLLGSACVQDFGRLHGPHIAAGQRQHGQGVSFSRDELYFEPVAALIGMHDGTYIPRRKRVFRDVMG